jgi:hypothetical protein
VHWHVRTVRESTTPLHNFRVTVGREQSVLTRLDYQHWASDVLNRARGRGRARAAAFFRHSRGGDYQSARRERVGLVLAFARYGADQPGQAEPRLGTCRLLCKEPAVHENEGESSELKEQVGIVLFLPLTWYLVLRGDLEASLRMICPACRAYCRRRWPGSHLTHRCSH